MRVGGTPGRSLTPMTTAIEPAAKAVEMQCETFPPPPP